MIDLQVRFVNEEVLVKMEKIPERVQELVAEKMRPLMEALHAKVTEAVERKFAGKSYPEMFTVEVDRIGSLTIGALEFQPSTKDYLIRVGSKGILANRETGFMSRVDVMHPPMTAASITTPMMTAYETMRTVIVEEIENVVHEAIYGI